MLCSLRFAAALGLAVLACALTAPIAVAEVCPKTSLPTIQEEVMCPVCGVPLANAGGPQAEDERDFIRERVDQCQSKEQIKAALVDEYGPRVLAVPAKSGFDLMAYLVPIAVLALALVGIVFGAVGWRRERAQETEAGAIDSSDAPHEIDQDMRRYDL